MFASSRIHPSSSGPPTLQTTPPYLGATGILILIEGRWHTGVGLTADDCVRLVSDPRNDVQLRMLDDPSYWGGPISDERYLLLSRS